MSHKEQESSSSKSTPRTQILQRGVGGNPVAFRPPTIRVLFDGDAVANARPARDAVFDVAGETGAGLLFFNFINALNSCVRSLNHTFALDFDIDVDAGDDAKNAGATQKSLVGGDISSLRMSMATCEVTLT